ncbi:MAG: hypothetical protein IJ558_05325 [Treponema sp.]|nr:hypothetical protein [Treponema sp.]
MQKAIIVNAYTDANDEWQEGGLDEVNELLEQGWKVVSCTPMGGAGYGYATAYGYHGNESHLSSHSDQHDMIYGCGIEFASVFVLEKN